MRSSGSRPWAWCPSTRTTPYTVKKLEHITPRGKLIEPGTVNQHLKLLGRMLRIALKWKLIREIPEITLLKERKSDFDFLDFEEADAFLAGAAERWAQCHPYMVLAIRTGLRVGEMVALRLSVRRVPRARPLVVAMLSRQWPRIASLCLPRVTSRRPSHRRSLASRRI